MKTILAVATFLIIFLSSNSAFSDCYCTCMDGKNQPICDSTIEIRPICSPKVCPIENISIDEKIEFDGLTFTSFISMLDYLSHSFSLRCLICL